MTMEIKITGGAELARALQGLSTAVVNRLSLTAARAGARVIADAAKERVPVKTGLLKGSIGVVDDVSGNRSGRRRTVLAGTPVFYARFVEYGTVHASAKPFLRPALDEHTDDAVNTIAQSLGQGIEREVR